MKASDLRIDNLLRDKVTKTELRVIKLTEQDIVTHVIDRSMYPLKDGWGIEPIPLTEKWLLDFGFSQQGKRPMWVKGKVCVVLASYPNLKGYLTDKKFYIGFKDLGNVIFHTTIECEHVHTLQNAAALTGEELKLKNHESKTA
jgi:hypothetical protein